MALGIDYSFARPGGAAIAQAGFSFVCRYLATAAGKRISAAEADELHAAGLSLVLVFEDFARPAQNYNGDATATGQRDAQLALSQANAIGFPADRPIYFAVDYDATESDQAWIDAYLRAAGSVIGAGRVGIYGGYYVVKRCLDHGTAKWGWQTLAWSGGQVDPRIHIYQNGQTAFGGGADIDESRQADFGQWPNNNAKAGGMFMIDENLLFNYYRYLLGRPPDDSGKATFTGQPADVVFQAIVDSDEFQAKQALEDAQNTLIETLKGSVAADEAKIKELTDKITELQTALDNAKPPTLPPQPPAPATDPNVTPGWFKRFLTGLSDFFTSFGSKN